MDPIASLLAFFIAAGLLTVTPGVDTALVLRTAAVEGPRRAVAAGAGIILGLFIWGALTAVGLTALLAVSKTAYLVLQIAGVGYLLFLGGRLLRAAFWGGSPAVEGAAAPSTGSTATWFMRGLMTNLLNPKVGVFYVSFLPQFMPAGADTLAWSLLLAGVHGLQTVAWFAALIAATRPLGRWLKRPAVVRWLDGVTGGLLVAFGVGLAMQRRAL
ncbi:LysE family transporter [Caulobacter sp. SLTY]|uniref:LysE family translocator n=1 Tax=Caulobacter sp. SLTY TaxID=2683262 RepID=UPI0014124B28|nr:LysE family translocator [Caulobacter sp. SLTY]NBB14955.1 LysE family transporter [Caulobacter sp. SLTY]